MGRKKAWNPVISIVEGFEQKPHRKSGKKMFLAIARGHGRRTPTAKQTGEEVMLRLEETSKLSSLTLLEGAGPEVLPLSI